MRDDPSFQMGQALFGHIMATEERERIARDEANALLRNSIILWAIIVTMLVVSRSIPQLRPAATVSSVFLMSVMACVLVANLLF